MQKSFLSLLFIYFATSFNFSKIPVKKYREEIKELRTKKQIDDYWHGRLLQYYRIM